MRKEDLERVMESDDFKRQVAWVNDWDDTDAERKLLADKLLAEKNKGLAEKALAEAKERFEALSADLVCRKEQLDEQRSAHRALKQWLADRQDRVDIYGKAGVVADQIDQLEDKRTNLEKSRRVSLSRPTRPRHWRVTSRKLWKRSSRPKGPWTTSSRRSTAL